MISLLSLSVKAILNPCVPTDLELIISAGCADLRFTIAGTRQTLINT